MFSVLPQVIFTRHIKISKYFMAYFFSTVLSGTFFIKREIVVYKVIIGDYYKQTHKEPKKYYMVRAVPILETIYTY
jgi:hypothetical protein